MPPIIVAIDCQALLGDIQTGLGVYARNLVEYLETFRDDVQVVRLYPSRKKPLSSTPQRLLWEQIKLPMAIAKSGCDIFHSPALSVPLLGSVKKVATAHDLIILKNPDLMHGLARRYFADFIPKTLKKADHIIANSRVTKGDLRRYLQIPEPRITVIPLGVEREFTTKSDGDLVNTLRRRFRLPGEYILSVASFEPRKNHSMLLKAFASVRQNLKEGTMLALVGRENSFQSKMKILAEELGISEYISFCGYLQTKELAAIYEGASMFVFPSLDEGFGIPILEAFAKGVPVIASDIAACRETASDAAIFINPNRPDEIGQAMRRVATDDAFRQSLIQKGTTRVAEFSWETHAREVIRIYYTVLGRTRDLK